MQKKKIGWIISLLLVLTAVVVLGLKTPNFLHAQPNEEEVKASKKVYGPQKVEEEVVSRAYPPTQEHGFSIVGKPVTTPLNTSSPSYPTAPSASLITVTYPSGTTSSNWTLSDYEWCSQNGGYADLPRRDTLGYQDNVYVKFTAEKKDGSEGPYSFVVHVPYTVTGSDKSTREAVKVITTNKYGAKMTDAVGQVLYLSADQILGKTQAEAQAAIKKLVEDNTTVFNLTDGTSPVSYEITIPTVETSVTSSALLKKYAVTLGNLAGTADKGTVDVQIGQKVKLTAPESEGLPDGWNRPIMADGKLNDKMLKNPTFIPENEKNIKYVYVDKDGKEVDSFKKSVDDSTKVGLTYAHVKMSDETADADAEPVIIDIPVTIWDDEAPVEEPEEIAIEAHDRAERSLQLKKTDQDGKPVEGATFTIQVHDDDGDAADHGLYYFNNGTFKPTSAKTRNDYILTSNADGLVTVPNWMLEMMDKIDKSWGGCTFRFREIEAPEGFLQPPKFSMNIDKMIDEVSINATWPDGVFIARFQARNYANGPYTARMENRRVPYDVQVDVVDSLQNGKTIKANANSHFLVTNKVNPAPSDWIDFPKNPKDYFFVGLTYKIKQKSAVSGGYSPAEADSPNIKVGVEYDFEYEYDWYELMNESKGNDVYAFSFDGWKEKMTIKVVNEPSEGELSWEVDPLIQFQETKVPIKEAQKEIPRAEESVNWGITITDGRIKDQATYVVKAKLLEDFERNGVVVPDLLVFKGTSNSPAEWISKTEGKTIFTSTSDTPKDHVIKWDKNSGFLLDLTRNQSYDITEKGEYTGKIELTLEYGP